MAGIIKAEQFIEQNTDIFDTQTVVLAKGKSDVSEISDPKIRGVEVNGHQIGNDSFNPFLMEVGIPPKYANTLPVHILIPQIDYLLSKRTDALSAEVSKKTEEIVKYGWNKSSISLSDVMDHVIEITGSDEVSSNSFVNGSQVVVYGTSESHTSEPVKGDIVQGGLMMNIDKGPDTANAALYLNRLVCTNGMVSTEKLMSTSKRKGTMDDFLRSVKEKFGDSCITFFDKIKALTNVNIKDPAMAERMIEQFARESYLSAFLKKALLEQVQAGIVESAYDLWNIMTKQATHGDYTDAQRLQMLQFTGTTAQKIHTDSNCNGCGRTFV